MSDLNRSMAARLSADLRNKREIRHGAPEGMRIYAIGDVHGRLDLLSQLIRRIDDHRARNPIGTAVEIFLGDYVDRGPSSCQVIEFLIDRVATHSAICLRGNHEELLLQFLQNSSIYKTWFDLGGAATLLSYGVVPGRQLLGADLESLRTAFRAAMPATHLEFLNSLPYSHTFGEYFFVHAGVRPGIAIARQAPHDMMWIREVFLSSKADFGKVIVHGHTPVMEPEILANRINIDTGAYATGKLTCLVVDGQGAQILGQVSEVC
jgi:serine/threonine protein phosphatase 1